MLYPSLPLTREVACQRQVGGREVKFGVSFVSPSVSLIARQPLTAAVPFVAVRHFPAVRGITPDKGRLLVSAVFKAPSDEGAVNRKAD